MSTIHSIPEPSEPTEAEIQHAAYLIWNERGRPEGCDLEHWFAAKEFLLHHHGHAAGGAKATTPPNLIPTAPKAAAPAPAKPVHARRSHVAVRAS